MMIRISSCSHNLGHLFSTRLTILDLRTHFPVLILCYRLILDRVLCICTDWKAFDEAPRIRGDEVGNRISRPSQPSRAFVAIRKRRQRYAMQGGLEIVCRLGQSSNTCSHERQQTDHYSTSSTSPQHSPHTPPRPASQAQIVPFD